jgi:glycosyltransferase involved in cell wall biosynthesis
MDYSVVVPAYNEEQLLPRTLEALRTAMAGVHGFRGELLVVDNNSSDRTAEVAAAHGARVVFEGINQISRARNRGAESARGQFLLFVDADTKVCTELIQAALTELASGRACGGGARVTSSDSTDPDVRRTMDLWNRLAQRMHWAAGAFVFCRREAWQAVGGFSLQVYASEEIWFSRAVRRWGRKRGQEFVILPGTFDTSMRKAEWYTKRQMLWMTIRFLFCPWLLRSREQCRLWYARPQTTTGAVTTGPEVSTPTVNDRQLPH